jgi:hypothetical protein
MSSSIAAVLLPIDEAAQRSSRYGRTVTSGDIIEALCGPTRTLDEARRPSADGGLPAAPGFYAWWGSTEALPGVAAPPHPSEPVGLLHVGIAPMSAASRSTLHSRVLGNHLTGNIGSSTLRLSLAALLIDELGLSAVARSTKVMLSPTDNGRLSEWQRDHLRLTWCVCPEPWASRDEVIDRLAPPLNLDGSDAHSHDATLKAARAALRATARVAPPA